jgi:hypothetical protein
MGNAILILFYFLVINNNMAKAKVCEVEATLATRNRCCRLLKRCFVGTILSRKICRSHFCYGTFFVLVEFKTRIWRYLILNSATTTDEQLEPGANKHYIKMDYKRSYTYGIFVDTRIIHELKSQIWRVKFGVNMTNLT